MQSENEFMQTIGAAYLALIHPERAANDARNAARRILDVGTGTPLEIAEQLIRAGDWRSRLAGFVLAARHGVDVLAETVIASLRNPRGIAIVPACALLAIGAEPGRHAGRLRELARDLADVFDGEIVWAVDRLDRRAGGIPDAAAGRGPNYGQDFEAHARFYGGIQTAPGR